MSKNIILLSDGTGNSNVKGRGTNVFKLYEALDFNSSKCKQVAFYDDGVGTQEFKPLKLLGGAFGWGLSRNVRQLYKQLVQCYDPGDKIYLFGYSRGAFTVRRLADFISVMGVFDKTVYQGEQLDNAVWHCFKKYRERDNKSKLALLENFYEPAIKIIFEDRIYKLVNKQLKFCTQKPSIEFIGVWDTVAAVGLPSDTATDFLNKYIFSFKFKGHGLHENVKQAKHALSIDDERQSFHPLLWQDHQRIEQVWFPGAHGNVGGGKPQQGLSLVTLDWMMKKAQAAGLEFVAHDVKFVQDREYAFDKLHNSRAGLGVFYRYKPRDIAKICDDEKNNINIKVPKIHVSVFERISQGIFGYAPGTIPALFEVVDSEAVTDAATLKKYQQIASSVSDEVAKLNSASLPGQVASHIKARQILYFVMLAYSVFTLYWLFRGDFAESGIFGVLKILVSPDALLEKLAALFWDHKILVLIGAIIFAGNVYVRKKIEAVYSEFWSRLRLKLADLLKGASNIVS